MADDVGGIFVSVTPDTEGFRDKLQAELEADSRGAEVRVEAHLDLDDESFDTGLDSADAKGKSFGSQKFTPRLDLDDGELADKFDANVARLNALTDKAWEIPVSARDAEAVAALDDLRQKLVDLTTEAYDGQIGLDGVDRVREQIDELEAKLDEFGERSVSAKVNVTGADSASADLDRAGQSADQASGLFEKLLGAAVAVSPALIPIGAVAVTGLGGVAALAGSAALGVGAFALAAKGDFAGIEASASTMLATFQATNRAVVLPALSETLPILQAGFTDIEPLVEGAATAIGHFGKEAESALTSPFWTSFFDLLGNQAHTSLTTFGNLAIGVGTALAGLDRAFAPVITDIENGLDRMAVSMEHFGASTGTNAGLQSFISYVEREGPQVIHVLGELASDFVTLTEDASRLGPSFLTIIGVAAQLLGDLEGLSPQLTEIAIAALSAYKAFQLLSPAFSVLKDVSNLGSLFSGSAEADTAASGLGRAAAAAGTYASSIRDAGTVSAAAAIDLSAVGTEAEAAAGRVAAAGIEAQSGFRAFAVGAEGAATTVEVAAADMGAASRAGAAEATAALGEVRAAEGEAAAGAEAAGASFLGVLGPLGLIAAAGLTLGHVFGEAAQAAGRAGDAIANDFAEKLASSGESVTQQIQTLQNYSQSLKTQIEDVAHSSGLGSKAFADLAHQAETTQGKISDLTDQEQANAQYNTLVGSTANVAASGLSAAGLQAQALAEKQLAARTSAQQFALATQQVAGALSAESTDVTNLSNALNILVGNDLAAKTAVTAQQQAVNSFSAALKAAHDNLTGTSDATLAAKASAESFGTTLYGTVVPALAKNGDTSAQVTQITEGLVAQFDAAAVHAGLTSAQVAQLNATYDLTPKDIATTITLYGASGAEAQAQAARAAFLATEGTYTAILNEQVEVTGQTPQIEGVGTILGIQHHASGTSFHPGGLAWVGEKGPELLDLPRGARVASNPQSMGLVQAGLVKAPGYAGGIGGEQEGYLFGTQVNVGLDAALKSDPHDINIGGVGGVGTGVAAPTTSSGLVGGSGGGVGTTLFQNITTSIVASLTSSLTALQTTAQNQGEQVIEAFTAKIKAGAIIPESTLYAIAAKLPASIGDAIEKAGPLTTAELKSLFTKLNADLPLSDIQAIASRLPNEIVAEIEKAGPLTTAQFKSLADSLTKTLTTASGDITKGLNGTFAQLSTQVASAVSAINKSFAGTSLDSLVDALGKNFDFLSTKAKDSLSTVTTALTAAQKAQASIQSQIAQNASTLEGQFSITSVTGATVTNKFTGATSTGPVTGASIISSLESDVANLRTYRNLLDTLKAWGLSQELLQELVAAGPTAGLQAAQALVAGGKKEVNLADVLQGAIDTTSTQIGTISATATISGKSVGLAQADGIVASLEASKTKITDELDKLAKDMQEAISRSLNITGGKSGTFQTLGDQMMEGIRQGINDSNGPLKAELEVVAKSMEAAIKAALGIKSPSTVFAEVGTNIVQGLAVGITGASGLADTALEGVWDGLTTKSKQKALAFDSGTLPTSLGVVGGSGAAAYSPVYNLTVNGDVGPATVKLIRSELDAHATAQMRNMPRYLR